MRLFMAKESKFFVGLPPNKYKIPLGFCEGKERDDDPSGGDGGIVVNIFEDCIDCEMGECHMFTPVYNGDNVLVGRRFRMHPPAY